MAAPSTNFIATNQLLCVNPAIFGTLTRSSPGSTDDEFRAGGQLPQVAANPANGHLYYVYPDRPTNSTDKSDIFFIQSTNGGTNWSAPIRANSDSGTNDQWQPVMTVKPDGTKLFIAWYDRREDTASNSLIRTYGIFADLPITGTNNFATNFPISTVAFPPVFTGTTMTNLNEFDLAYPPRYRNDGTNCPTFFGAYAGHMGDYDTAVSDNTYVYYTWSDKRNKFTNSVSGVIRNQADIRFIKVSWPH